MNAFTPLLYTILNTISHSFVAGYIHYELSTGASTYITFMRVG